MSEAGPTFFDTMKRNFKDVSVSDTNAIQTTEFLEAAEGLVQLFDLLGSKTFAIVQSDMNGNIAKIRAQQLENPAGGETLQDIVLEEVARSQKNATQGLLWLNRGLEFTAVAMRRNVENPSEELTVSFTKAYSCTLSQYHNMLVRPVFKVAMKAVPYRKDFYAKLGSPLSRIEELLREWLSALERIVDIIKSFLASGNYAKGL